jgi:hypothetical protein
MTSQTTNFGYGGGGAPDLFSAQAPAAESALATEAPAAAAPAEEPPSVLLAPQPTATIASEDSSREIETPADKQGLTGETDVEGESQPQSPISPPVPQSWLIALALIVLLGASIMVLMRQSAASRWRK